MDEVADDTGTGRILDDRVALTQMQEFAEEQGRSGRMDRHHRELLGVGLVREGDQLRGFGHNVAGPGADAERQEGGSSLARDRWRPGRTRWTGLTPSLPGVATAALPWGTLGAISNR